MGKQDEDVFFFKEDFNSDSREKLIQRNEIQTGIFFVGPMDDDEACGKE